MSTLRILRVALILAFISQAVALNAHALVKFDFEQKFFVEFGPEVKDHTLIRHNGTYHLFYLRGNPAVDIGHATSTDLVHWDLLPPILDTFPGTWDDRAMWAPHIVQLPEGNTWIMYYTGVNLAWAQQTGIAMSTDLVNWFKVPWPVYHPDENTWAAWSIDEFAHGRDPFFFEYGGLFYMLNTAKTWFNRGAISCAASTDGFTWTDHGPLYVHTNWHVLESVQLIQRNNMFHLFFTEEVIAGTSHMPSDSLFSGWDIANRSVIDLGHAPEVNVFDGDTYIFSRHTTSSLGNGNVQFAIRFDTLMWSGNTPFVSRPWPLAQDWTTDQTNGLAFFFAPTYLNNSNVRGDTVDVGFEGLCWLSSYEQYQGPLGIGIPGLFQGDGATGKLRSRTFTVTGNSMSLRVGGGNYPDDCYVALVDAQSDEILLSETGKNVEAMDTRLWNISPYQGTDVYIEICDTSMGPFGHINCDIIEESATVIDVVPGGEGGGGGRQGDPNNFTGPRATPSVTKLFQNSPNPFNPTTTISYHLARQAAVSIDIFAVDGRRVRRLVSKSQSQGAHEIEWDGRDQRGQAVSSGIYFYRLRIGSRDIDTKKMMLLK